MNKRDLIKEILSGNLDKRKHSNRNSSRRNTSGLDLGEKRILKIEDDPHYTPQTESTSSKRQEFVDSLSVTIINIGHKVDPSEEDFKTETKRKKSKEHGGKVTIINNGKVGKSTTRNYETFTGDINLDTLDIEDDDREIEIEI